MTDGVIKGTGNSRYLKTVSTAPTTYPTYESFIQALAAGTLSIDLNGINSTGWTTQGTKLNKANLLTDATAALAGLTSSATPNTMFAKLANLITSLDTEVNARATIETGSYVGTVSPSDHSDPNYTALRTKTLNFSGVPKFVLLFKNSLKQNDHGYVYIFTPSNIEVFVGGAYGSANNINLKIFCSWSANQKSVTLTGGDISAATNDSLYTYTYHSLM